MQDLKSVLQVPRYVIIMSVISHYVWPNAPCNAYMFIGAVWFLTNCRKMPHFVSTSSLTGAHCVVVLRSTLYELDLLYELMVLIEFSLAWRKLYNAPWPRRRNSVVWQRWLLNVGVMGEGPGSDLRLPCKTDICDIYDMQPIPKDIMERNIGDFINFSASRLWSCRWNETLLVFSQAYTSQFVALVMFGMMMCEDRVSKRERYNEIFDGLKVLPGKLFILTQQPAEPERKTLLGWLHSGSIRFQSLLSHTKEM